MKKTGVQKSRETVPLKSVKQLPGVQNDSPVMNTPRSLDSPVVNTPVSLSSPVVNTPGSLDSPVMNTPGSRLLVYLEQASTPRSTPGSLDSPEYTGES